MDEVSLGVTDGSNTSGGGSGDYWTSDDDPPSPLPLDGSGLFSGNFVPPPPRPLFLDDRVTPDGVTTCDLCTWAWEHGGNGGYTFDATKEIHGELGWVLTLVIVSLSSALIGAVVMIIVLHCKRMKNAVVSESDRERSRSRNVNSRPPINTPDDKDISAITPATFPDIPGAANANGVWSWLARRSSTPPSNLNNPPSSPAENHYTHMEDGYSNVDGEALYAELDRTSSADENDRESNSPAYQNGAYTDPEAPASSAPSSAYYSDLSITTVPDRAYEVVGLATMPCWDPSPSNNIELRRPMVRLASISESVSVPSDYV